jgi:hypothetical protein
VQLLPIGLVRIAPKKRKKAAILSCYNFGKKLPFLSVVLWKFIIEMFLISRCAVLTIRFTVLLQDVTH